MAEETANAPAPAPAKADRIVELQDGSKVNFGIRANLLTSFDLESMTITFKIITGEVINWAISGGIHAVESFTEFQKTVYMYGLLAKVKTNLAPVKVQETVEVETGEVDGEGKPIKESRVVNSLALAIMENIASIDAGKFNVRGPGSDEDFELSLDQKAYAIIMRKYKGKEEWADLDNPEVITAVQAAWDSKTTPEKNAIRKNAFFKGEKVKLEQANAKPTFDGF